MCVVEAYDVIFSETGIILPTSRPVIPVVVLPFLAQFIPDFMTNV